MQFEIFVSKFHVEKKRYKKKAKNKNKCNSSILCLLIYFVVLLLLICFGWVSKCHGRNVGAGWIRDRRRGSRTRDSPDRDPDRRWRCGCPPGGRPRHSRNRRPSGRCLPEAMRMPWNGRPKVRLRLSSSCPSQDDQNLRHPAPDPSTNPFRIRSDPVPGRPRDGSDRPASSAPPAGHKWNELLSSIFADLFFYRLMRICRKIGGPDIISLVF